MSTETRELSDEEIMKVYVDLSLRWEQRMITTTQLIAGLRAIFQSRGVKA